jgi:hypothetical protein
MERRHHSLLDLLLEKRLAASEALPSIFLYGAPVEDACLRAALAMLTDVVNVANVVDNGDLPRMPDLKPATSAVVTMSGKRVAIDHAFTSNGTLVATVVPQPPEGEPGHHVQAGLLTLLRETSRIPHVDSMRRRGIVLCGAHHLTVQVQHALRKVIESSTQSALFVLIAPCANGLDAALRSRSVAVNCSRFATPAASDEFITVDAAFREFCKNKKKQRPLIQALIAGGPRAFAHLVEHANDDHQSMRLASVAAEVDHRSTETGRRCPALASIARELAARQYILCLQGS